MSVIEAPTLNTVPLLNICVAFGVVLVAVLICNGVLRLAGLKATRSLILERVLVPIVASVGASALFFVLVTLPVTTRRPPADVEPSLLSFQRVGDKIVVSISLVQGEADVLHQWSLEGTPLLAIRRYDKTTHTAIEPVNIPGVFKNGDVGAAEFLIDTEPFLNYPLALNPKVLMHGQHPEERHAMLHVFRPFFHDVQQQPSLHVLLTERDHQIEAEYWR
jgi:hypothetical protein